MRLTARTLFFALTLSLCVYVQVETSHKIKQCQYCSRTWKCLRTELCGWRSAMRSKSPTKEIPFSDFLFTHFYSRLQLQQQWENKTHICSLPKCCFTWRNCTTDCFLFKLNAVQSCQLSILAQIYAQHQLVFVFIPSEDIFMTLPHLSVLLHDQQPIRMRTRHCLINICGGPESSYCLFLWYIFGVLNS